MKKNKKVLILVNYLSFFLSHRLAVGNALLAQGFEVFIGYGELRGANPKILEEKGFKVSFVPIQPGGVNFFRDLLTFYNIWKFFKEVNPDVVHLVTIKPYLYGGIISRLIGIPSLISAVSGLGTLFISDNLKTKILRILLRPIYKFAFNHKNQKIIIQNEDDLKSLEDWGVLKSSKVKLLKGSGVKLQDFKNIKDPEGVITISFAGRLLRDKGVLEFISAAAIIKKRGIVARFFLAGDFDINNPSGISPEDLKKINKDNYVEILGYQSDIPALYEKSNIVCLPSYREGLPKCLIEAAAAGKSIVTTNVPGCRQAVIPDVTGILVPPRDSSKLADAIQWLIEHPLDRISMGKAGRKFAEKEFSIEKIVQNHLEIYQDLLRN